MRGRLSVWSAPGLVYVGWGSTSLAIRYSLETIPPLLGGAARFLAAAVVRSRTAVRGAPGSTPGAVVAEGTPVTGR